MISAVRGMGAVSAALTDRLKAAYQDAANADRPAQEATAVPAHGPMTARPAAAIVADGRAVASIDESGQVVCGGGGYEAAIAWMTLGGMPAQRVATQISNAIGTTALAVKL